MSALHGAAGWWLLQLAWLSLAATVVFAVVWLVSALLPRPAAGLRHALLLLVLLRLVVPPGVTSPLSAGRLLVALQPPAPATLERGAGLSAAAGGTASATQPSAPRPPWPLALVGLWALGAAAVGRRRWRERRVVRRLVAAGEPVGNPEARAAISQWCGRLGIRRRVRLLAVAAPVVPFTAGTLRPVVVLPRRLIEAAGPRDEGLLEAVVAHELAHVARLDDLWLALEHVAGALFFFHPVVWRTADALSVERELAADRRVLTAGAMSARSYGRALLRALGLDLETTTAAAAAGRRGRLTMRIRHIADPRTSTRPGRRQGLLAAALVALLAAALLPPSGAAAPSVAAATEGQPPRVASLAALLATDPSLDEIMPGARLTSGFGMRPDPFGNGAPKHHDGVDLATGERSPVHAPRGGVVERVEHDYGRDGRFGTVVVVDHGGGLRTFYAHLDSAAVKVGDGLMRGDLIGRAGNTGVSAGPHLHFELWKDGAPVDPSRIAEVLEGC